MNATFILVAAAVILLTLFVYLATRRSTNLLIDDARASLRSLDFEAFCNLVDPEEEAFLRSSLPAAEFRRIQRERAWAALAYVRGVSHAALQYARLGDAYRRSPNPSIAASGLQIANAAIRLRLYALQASIQLMITAILPGLRQRFLSSFVARYRCATDLFLHNDFRDRLPSANHHPSS